MTFHQSHSDLLASFHATRLKLAQNVADGDVEDYNWNVKILDDIKDALHALYGSWATATIARASVLKGEREEPCQNTPS
jgi:hypothetical protein